MGSALEQCAQQIGIACEWALALAGHARIYISAAWFQTAVGSSVLSGAAPPSEGGRATFGAVEGNPQKAPAGQPHAPWVVRSKEFSGPGPGAWALMARVYGALRGAEGICDCVEGTLTAPLAIAMCWATHSYTYNAT